MCIQQLLMVVERYQGQLAGHQGHQAVFEQQCIGLDDNVSNFNLVPDKIVNRRIRKMW